MYKQFYQGMSLTELPLFALVLFIAVFLGVVAWVFVARRSGDFDTLARMPLSEKGEGGHEQ
ncbi:MULTISPECIES: cbb3-type cytochrome oxidase subunit 3 [Myxococcus]|uniref:Cytochrome oxidase n=1 Tax=Myxococcus xanthus TaxID=34 RepID=A0AAE6KUH9_MYXXA|nr:MULTISPECIES: CcoQ/FixQ family Cbb3-type cytochrome c oxidase assembly chaperone [Myxococcus]QDE70449.1 cytochrome oxidase [Myxococcus xanthus]QDE77729.1 cytochrome oxidase [Myxococcus xanthus]QDE85114.1 cytochrome oxidase [Myxococcus xanthus]QDE99273.1 cytochrome oxidase [Myxococcus xanthus]QDF06970.1 cytochrome oxidase [Myxococcus xanthus]